MITQKNILTVPNGKYALGDNLVLKVTSEKSRRFIFNYRKDGKRKYHTVGSAFTMSLKKARDIASTLYENLQQGIYPDEADQTSGKRIKTLADYIPYAIEVIRNTKKWTNKKHAQQWTNTLNTYVTPFIGHKAVGSITREDIIQVIRPIWETKNETASRVLGRLSSILQLAIVEGLRTDNPANWSEGLQYYFPRRSKVHEVKHHQATSVPELSKACKTLKERGTDRAFCVIFGALTATRVQEFVLAQWCEFDFQSKTWTIPAGRMKMKKAHAVPLSSQAIELLKSIKRDDKSPYVFQEAGKPFSKEMPRNQLIKALGGKVTMHGCRSTFRDWCAENLIHDAIAEKSLAHETGSKVVQAYQRSDLLEQRRPVMQQWADTLLGDGNE